MKLRFKIMLMNLITITCILLLSGWFLLRAADNSNLFSTYQYLLRQSGFCQQLIEETYGKGTAPDFTQEKVRLEAATALKKYIPIDFEILSLSISNPDEIQRKALSGNKAYFIDTHDATREFSLAFPVYANGKQVCVIVLKEKLAHADSMRKELQYVALVTLLVTLIALAIVSYLVAYRMIKPLEKLAEVARKFSLGEFQEIEDVNTHDEIELLSRDFNEMGKSLNHMIQQLQTEQKKQKDFYDSVTHEIRTPITNIIGYADLTSRVDDPSEQARYLSYISSEGNRLLSMVNNLLELSSIKNFQFSIDKTSFRLDTLVRESTALMHDTAAKFGYLIDTQLEEGIVYADREKLKQVFINLIDNAIKHSDGTLVKVRLENTPTLKLEIADNGKGIPAELLDKLTLPFFRAGNSNSSLSSGTGLGLSICSEILAAHGFSMAIHSEEGIGTTVSVQFQTCSELQK